MKKEDAEKLWESFMSHPSMLMMPKRNELLRPSKRQKNFLGSAAAYKAKFLKSMENFEI